MSGICLKENFYKTTSEVFEKKLLKGKIYKLKNSDSIIYQADYNFKNSSDLLNSLKRSRENISNSLNNFSNYNNFSKKINNFKNENSFTNKQGTHIFHKSIKELSQTNSGENENNYICSNKNNFKLDNHIPCIYNTAYSPNKNDFKNLQEERKSILINSDKNKIEAKLMSSNIPNNIDAKNFSYHLGIPEFNQYKNLDDSNNTYLNNLALPSKVNVNNVIYNYKNVNLINSYKNQNRNNNNANYYDFDSSGNNTLYKEEYNNTRDNLRSDKRKIISYSYLSDKDQIEKNFRNSNKKFIISHDKINNNSSNFINAKAFCNYSNTISHDNENIINNNANIETLLNPKNIRRKSILNPKIFSNQNINSKNMLKSQKLDALSNIELKTGNFKTIDYFECSNHKNKTLFFNSESNSESNRLIEYNDSLANITSYRFQRLISKIKKNIKIKENHITDNTSSIQQIPDYKKARNFNSKCQSDMNETYYKNTPYQMTSINTITNEETLPFQTDSNKINNEDTYYKVVDTEKIQSKKRSKIVFTYLFSLLFRK